MSILEKLKNHDFLHESRFFLKKFDSLHFLSIGVLNMYNALIKQLYVYLISLLLSLILISLALIFPEYKLIDKYFYFNKISNISVLIVFLMIFIKYQGNSKNIKIPNLMKLFITFLINRISIRFISNSSFYTSAIIINLIYGYHESLLFYLILGFFCLAFGLFMTFINLNIEFLNYSK